MLYPNVGVSTVDYAFGIDGGTLWQSVPASSNLFRWYGGNTIVATLTGVGVFSVAGSTSQINVDNLRLDGNTLSANDTDGSLIIAPNGNGALIASSTTANARGAKAVDLQNNRSAVTQVASGTNSVIGGGANNTSSGNNGTVGGGNSNTSSGYISSTVGGGNSNTSSGYDSSTVGGGRSNISSGSFSTVGGGHNNTSSSTASTVGGGDRNLAFSERSFVGAGQSNVSAGKVRRANSITSSTNTITVLSATAADFDNTTANALQIRYRIGTVGAWNNTTRTVSTATQSGANVTLVVTSNVGASSPNQWTRVTVLNTAETDTTEGQVVGGGTNNISTNTHGTVGGGKDNTSSGNSSTVGGGYKNTAIGNSSTVGGGTFNTSSGNISTVGGGNSNTSSGYASTVGGGTSNTSSGNNSTVGGGNYNSATAYFSTVGGGRYNEALGYGSTVSGGFAFTYSGYGNRAIGDFSTVGGGGGGYQAQSYFLYANYSTNTANGYGSTVSGGVGNIANNYMSCIPGGLGAKTSIPGELAHSAGIFSQIGDAQHSIFVLNGITTSVTPLNLTAGPPGIDSEIIIPSERILSGTINIIGTRNTGANVARYLRQFTIKNVGGTPSLVGSIITLGTDVADGTSISITAVNSTPDVLRIAVTGKASENWRWVAVVDCVSVEFVPV